MSIIFKNKKFVRVHDEGIFSGVVRTEVICIELKSKGVDEPGRVIVDFWQ
jgi:hypothetical protein